VSGRSPDLLDRYLVYDWCVRLIVAGRDCSIGLPTPQAFLPRHLEVAFYGDARGIPTHLLAFHSWPGPKYFKDVILHPVHSVVIIPQCTALRPLPPSQATQVLGAYELQVALPVVTCSVPSLDTIGLLLEFLYSHEINPIMEALLPIETSGFGPSSFRGHKEQIVERCDQRTITAFLTRTQGLHLNVFALGVLDADLYAAINYAWQVLWEASWTKAAPHDLVYSR
jgi:hypothetical protein